MTTATTEYCRMPNTDLEQDAINQVAAFIEQEEKKARGRAIEQVAAFIKREKKEAKERADNESAKRKQMRILDGEKQDNVFRRIAKKYYRNTYGRELHDDQGINFCAFWIIYRLLVLHYGVRIWEFEDIVKVIDSIQATYPHICRPIGEEQTEEFLSNMLGFYGFSILKKMKYGKNTPKFVRENTEDVRVLGFGNFVEEVIIHETDGTFGHFRLENCAVENF